LQKLDKGRANRQMNINNTKEGPHINLNNGRIFIKQLEKILSSKKLNRQNYILIESQESNRCTFKTVAQLEALA
jgi:hypothetical protein